jgi:trk system potassium uptake protein
MHIVIIGGGNISYYLVKTLQPSRHDITVIEMKKEICEKIATDFEVNAFHGDGTNIALLDQAKCRGADFFVAVTGKDESNLIACEIAKKKFAVKKTVAKVNNPKNIEMFVRLGVDKPFSSTQILANVIEQEIEYAGMRVAFNIENSTKTIIEFNLSPKSTAVNKTLKEYSFPGDGKIVLITRSNGEIIMPQGDVFMKAEDTILMVCDERHYDVIWRLMVKR